MADIPAREAAHLLGMSLGELIHSRQRGLPPGKFGFKRGGRLMFDSEQLVPAPRATIDYSKLKVADLRELLAARGTTIPSGALKADLIKLAEE